MTCTTQTTGAGPPAPGFTPRPHPVLKLPGDAAEASALIARLGGKEKFLEWLQERERLIDLEKLDPFRFGMILQHWKDADQLLTESKRLLILGGNRSAKSKYAARKVVEQLMAKEDARVMCLQTTGPNSIALQQPYVHDFLPAEWRGARRGEVVNMKYSRKGGFTEGTFVAPNGSQCWFYNYAQDIEVLEGWELDMVWCDELVPWAWVETLNFRLVTRGGTMIITFTPTQGYTMTVKQICDGARVKKWRKSELLPDTVNVPRGPVGMMPYVTEPVNPNWRVIFFHSDMNPFGNYPELVKECRGKDSAFVKVRAYGYTEKTFGDVFPLFSVNHLIDPADVPTKGTRYCIADPAGARNWFIIWVLLDEFSRHFVYREWPDADRYGEWAVPSEEGGRFDGAVGPAQRTLGYGIADYKRTILEEEGNRIGADGTNVEGEYILERIMDPRAGKAQVQADKGGTCLLDRMDEEQLDQEGKVIGPSMPFLPGSGIEIEEKVGAINDLLSFNTAKPIEPLVNEPRLYVSRKCRNVIWALQNWTGMDRQKGACKDPIDVLGMAAAEDLKYVEGGSLTATGGGAYG